MTEQANVPGSPPKDPEPFPPFGVHKRAHVYESPWCSLRRDEVVLPSGALQEYHVFEIGPAVTVVPVLEDGRVVMIGQYRYPTGLTRWELPAGRIGDGETPQATAVRELYEETGYAAGAGGPNRVPRDAESMKTSIAAHRLPGRSPIA